nr:MAG TPA: hypothetical protein [Caudoviricetes sp.]
MLPHVGIIITLIFIIVKKLVICVKISYLCDFSGIPAFAR